jgi:hypothetical protein
MLLEKKKEFKIRKKNEVDSEILKNLNKSMPPLLKALIKTLKKKLNIF